MKPSATLTRSSEGKSGKTSLRLNSVRTKHMFEQAHAIIDLCADGREKLTGTYIFDGHYIFSLVDRIIDHSREMVFDASIIAPDGSRTCYAAFDNCKSAAEKLFLKKAAPESGDTPANDSADGFESTAEYRLLHQALDWIGCHDKEAGMSVIELLNRVLRHVLSAFEKTAKLSQTSYRLDIACPGIVHRIACMDMGGAVRSATGSAVPLDDLQCRPLALLVRESCSESDPAPSSGSQPVKNWWALAGSRELSLFGAAAGAPVWLDVVLPVDDSTGHVLLWSPADKVDLPEMPPDCRAAMSSAEVMLWKSGRRNADLGRVLTAMAGGLLAGRN